ncbi:hypothetical protein N7493_000229 [Penicillium malachiteum]|uniref:Uncharacterized protein n=1 Tax=Penicillium malachiteum TaxID=1324776 RepID=A0AAD6HWR0_9EURO|nr:hypothetical protein N7493_000229 [Penicillium malachiteum]
MQFNHPAPVFDLDPYNPSDTIYVLPGSTHNVFFPTYESFEALCLCWTGLASLYLVGVEMSWLGSPHDPQNTTLGSCRVIRVYAIFQKSLHDFWMSLSCCENDRM